jgi:hypothetical protein
MNGWVVLVLVLIILILLGALAYYVESLPLGQVVAVIVSLTAATVGLWIFLKEPSLSRRLKGE